jgi:hypothetical protein
MLRGRVSDDVKKAALLMSLDCRDEDVCGLMKISVRSLRRWRRADRLIGGGLHKPAGRPCLLYSSQEEVCLLSPFSVTDRHLIVL